MLVSALEALASSWGGLLDRIRPSGRVPAPVRVSSSPHPNTNLVPCLPPRISSISGAPSGDREDAGQRSAGDRSRSGPRLLQPPLPGGKGDGRLASCDRPVDSEHLHSTDTIQDGDCSLRLERCPRERSPRLPGLEGRVLSSARPSKFQEVSVLCVTGDSVPVQGSLLRTVHCPPSLHESVRSCVSVGALSRDSASPLLGRLAGSGLLRDQSPSARPRPALVVSRSGNRGQQGEVGSHALTFCELSRDDDRHSGGQGFSLESESGEVPSPGGQLCKVKLPPCSAVGGAPRTSLIAQEAGSPRLSAVALHAVATEDVLVSRGRSSRSPSRVDSGDSRGPVLVDRGVPSSPGGSIRDSSSGSSSVHGRLLCGLGRSPARPKGVWEVVGGGANVAHQSSRDEGSLARTAIFSEDSHRPSSDGNVRQLDGSSVCQQARRNAFSFHVRADKSPSQMDRGHRCPFGSEIPARTEQHPSGSLKPSGSGHCYGVDSPPSGGEGTPELVGLAVDRPVRVETQRSATGLLLPSPGRPGGSRGCVSASLGQPGRVRVSTLCSAREGSVTSTAVSKLFDDSGSSSLGRQGLVRGSTAPADASTSRSASVGRRRSPAPQRSTPPRRPRVETSRVATVKQLLRKSGFSRGAASDMSRCVRESTSNVYQSKWLAFCNWCRGRGVAPVSASVPLIVDFFRHLVRDKGLSVPAVRGYRASLNSVFALKGRDLAASREVSMLFRSFSKTARPERLRPPNWDISLVLQSLTRAPYEPLRSADERFLAQKTLVLIALASAKRIGELHALSYRVSHSRAWGEVSFVFVPGFVAKTQDPSSQDPRFDSFTIPALPKARDNPNGRLLCPVRAVKLYLRRTAPHRPACERLFLTTGPNPKEIAKNTISFWLRKTIARAYELAGRSLPVPAPRARETRGIAPSLLYRKNFALPQVLSAGTWRRHTTFTRHYLRDLAHKSLDTYHLGPVVAAQALV